MKHIFAIGLAVIICSYSHCQIPVDTLHYFSLSEAEEANPDTIFAIDLSTPFLRKGLKEVPSELKKYNHLQGLKLTNNNLSSLPKFFSKFTTLRFLYLDKNKFTLFPPQIFALTNLVYLDICRNKIVGIPDGIRHLTKLKYLDVWDNRFVSIAPSFAELQQLEYLDLRGTSYPKTFEDRWKKALPDTEIIFDPPCNCLE